MSFIGVPIINGFVLALLLAVLSTGCSKNSNDIQKELLVAAAANLQPAFAELADKYGQNTGVKITVTYGSSGTLATQIANGAPIDLFASASQKFIDDLKGKGLITEGSDRPFAVGRLVLATNSRSGLQVKELQDILRPEVKKIAIANPQVAPFGAAAREALSRAGLWENIQDKVVYSENVGQALQYLMTGNVEGSFISLPDANVPGVSYLLVDQALYSPIIQSMAIIRGTRHEAEAKAFESYILGPEGVAALKKYGYRVLGEP
ncbi:MAG: putative transporter substrate binding protein [Dehalococcoidia bacterium]|nr:putative transporter substrate binding protein [Dehalococcoidia bacterium]